MDQNPEIPLKETPEKTTEKRVMEQGEASSTNAKPMGKSEISFSFLYFCGRIFIHT